MSIPATSSGNHNFPFVEENNHDQFDFQSSETDYVFSTKDHRELSHRDDPDQHPISAITGLQQRLSVIEGNLGGIPYTVVSRW